MTTPWLKCQMFLESLKLPTKFEDQELLSNYTGQELVDNYFAKRGINTDNVICIPSSKKKLRCVTTFNWSNKIKNVRLFLPSELNTYSLVVTSAHEHGHYYYFQSRIGQKEPEQLTDELLPFFLEMEVGEDCAFKDLAREFRLYLMRMTLNYARRKDELSPYVVAFVYNNYLQLHKNPEMINDVFQVIKNEMTLEQFSIKYEMCIENPAVMEANHLLLKKYLSKE